MKKKLFISKNIPYFLAGGTILVGVVVLVFHYLTLVPITRDPNIGADMEHFLGVSMIIGGVLSCLIIALTRQVKRLTKK